MKKQKGRMKMRALNLLLRFLLEMIALIIYGYWGFKVGKTTGINWVIGVGAPLAIALLWGIFGSPKAPVQLSELQRLLFEIVIFGIPVLLLIVINKSLFALVYGGLFIVNRVLIYVWNQ